MNLEEKIDSELLDYIERCDIISFDLFDTLIFRHLEKPSDLFQLVEIKYNIQSNEKIANFKNNRMLAEKSCRKIKNGSEITIDEIYDKLSEKYKNINLDRIKEIEKDLEIKVSFPNNKFMLVYKYCLKKSKKIIITTDMYLDLNTIKCILNKNGITNYDNVYLSSKYGYRKKSGLLFDIIIKDYNIMPEKILHIGDNVNSDILQAKSKNIKTWLVKNEYRKLDLFESFEKSILVNGFLKNNNYANKDYYYILGQYVLGPLLYGYVVWLNNKINEIKADKVIFLSRDGAIMKRAYECCFGKHNGNMYAYASRRALIVPTLWENFSVEKLQKSINLHDRITVKDLLQRLGLEKSEYIKELQEINLCEDDLIKGTNLKNDKQFLKIYEKFEEKIILNSKEEYISAKKYWNNVVKKSKKIAVIDIGWNGNMQNALKILLNNKCKIYGLYLGVNPHSKHRINMNGYLFDKNHNLEIKQIIDNFSGVLETMFMTNHGSVKKYISQAPNYELYPNEYSSKYGQIVNEIEAIDNLQLGAIDFIHKFGIYIEELGVPFETTDAYANLFNLGLHPTLNSSMKIGDFRFLNSSCSYLAYPIYNHFNLKELVNTNWRVGYLKRCFKININYYTIAKAIKSLKKIIKK